MRKRDIFTICIAWSIFIYIGYNVLTVEAAEKDDKKVCESYGGKWTEYNEDFGGDRYCKIDNEKDQRLYGIRPGDSLDGTHADAETGRIDLGMSDDEAAVLEDDICYNEDADSTDVKGCMSEKREKQMKDIKKTCDKVDGKMTSEGCVTDNDGPKADRFHEEQDEDKQLTPITKYPDTEINIEDWRNEVNPVVEEEEEEEGWKGAQGMRFYDSEEEMEKEEKEEKEQELEEKAEEATEQEEEAMEEADDSDNDDDDDDDEEEEEEESNESESEEE